MAKTKWELTWWELPSKPMRENDGIIEINHDGEWEEMTQDDAIECVDEAATRAAAIRLAKNIKRRRKPMMYWGEVRLDHMELRRTNYDDGGPEFLEWDLSGQFDSVEV